MENYSQTSVTYTNAFERANYLKMGFLVLAFQNTDTDTRGTGGLKYRITDTTAHTSSTFLHLLFDIMKEKKNTSDEV